MPIEPLYYIRQKQTGRYLHVHDTFGNEISWMSLEDREPTPFHLREAADSFLRILSKREGAEEMEVVTA